MGLFSRMFGTTEQDGEIPGSDQTQQAGELTQWPFVKVPVQQGSSAPPARSAPALPPPLPPVRPQNSNAARIADAGDGDVRRASAHWPIGRVDEPPAAPQDAALFATRAPPAPADSPNIAATSQPIGPAARADAAAPRERPPAAPSVHAEPTHARKGATPASKIAAASAVASARADARGSRKKSSESTAAGPAVKSTPASVVRELQAIVVRPPEAAPPSGMSVPAMFDDAGIDLVLDALGSDAPPSSTTDDDAIELVLDGLGADALPSATWGQLAEHQADKLENSARLRQMALDHALPLREFMLALGLGPTTKQWLEGVRPALSHLRKAAETLDQAGLSTLLASLDAAVTRAAKTDGQKITGSERDTLLFEYDRLARELPLAFDLKNEREQREPVVVHHLLRQVPGVHMLTIDKLRAAGLDTLDALCRSSVADLVAFARLDTALADAISRRFRSYWRECTERPYEQAKQRLRALLERLGRAHAEYERAEAAEDRTKKRSARNERRSVSLEMTVLLAQIGEVQLVEELERSATERKIERIRRYLQQPFAGPGPALGEWT